MKGLLFAVAFAFCVSGVSGQKTTTPGKITPVKPPTSAATATPVQKGGVKSVVPTKLPNANLKSIKVTPTMRSNLTIQATADKIKPELLKMAPIGSNPALIDRLARDIALALGHEEFSKSPLHASVLKAFAEADKEKALADVRKDLAAMRTSDAVRQQVIKDLQILTASKVGK
jgi:hypothetical protein